MGCCGWHVVVDWRGVWLSVLKIGLDNILHPLLLCACLVGAPHLATFLLGMFTRRTTGHGAFAGLAAGSVAALLHYGLTLPGGAARGYYGGWIAGCQPVPRLAGAVFLDGGGWVCRKPCCCSGCGCWRPGP